MSVQREFSWTWQAGFVLVFNEGQQPKFDAMDTALVGRMIYVPMRSKFIAATDLKKLNEEGTVERHTFALDPHVGEHFDGWLSPLAELLLEHYRPHDFSVGEIPASMLEWRAEAAAEANPASELAADVLEVTGDPSHCVLVAELFAAYINPAQGIYGTLLKKAEFFRYAKAHFQTVGGLDRNVVFHEAPSRCVRRNGANDLQKNVVRGVRWQVADVKMIEPY